MILMDWVFFFWATLAAVKCDKEVWNAMDLSNDITYGNASHHRHKRIIVDTTFRGNPKTIEEKWNENFKIENIYQQSISADRLVMLLNKVVNKYLRACVSIVLYDKFVENTDSIILQTFFQVSRDIRGVGQFLYNSLFIRNKYLSGKNKTLILYF